MQKALQNPDYKKIWERVMMNRHPEVKSLEEALKSESKEALCLIETDTGINFIAILEEQCNQYDSYPFYNIHKIYGREITLEDILILLSNLKNDNKITMQDIDIAVKNTCILPEKKRLDNHCICIEIIKYLEQEDGDEDEEMIYLYFDIVKPLHEQTSQVWEDVSKLID